MQIERCVNCESSYILAVRYTDTLKVRKEGVEVTVYGLKATHCTSCDEIFIRPDDYKDNEETINKAKEIAMDR